ncbi:ATP-dependent DNA helicase [Penicillium daleae]|uniref:ATP-dependent DNA helicase n=1 Tax=Penicillium daleae TaxID=63821 RepID=A0AAD6CH97_9EURO|nr:ATP-dependent DNA helicase [Penicillium daleae]KAJ5465272.1 ATP-dependent DNA helicase [Penicillium daleae]
MTRKAPSLNFRIGQTEVPPAQFRWHADGETLVWLDVIFHLSDLHRIIFEGIAEARRIFDQELCLSGRSSPACDIPGLDLGLLVDNWDATAPGRSFLTDSRNASYFDPLKDWLVSRVGKTQALFHTLWSQTAAGTWEVCADAVQQYEDAVQRFLRALMVPFFLWSGQQGRRTEFIALRWRNTTWITRDLFLLDGQMLFILSYHKTRNQNNASRWPVRFLLPQVAKLVTQYLALVQPFRTFLQHETLGSRRISDYLWSRGPDLLGADGMTRVIVDAGKLTLGKHIHVQSWRQITVGIARRKFARAEANLLIEDGGDDEEADPALGSMSDGLHWQAGHPPYTGNRVYGGTVNFRAGLTGTGLQEFRHVSQLWHRFLRDPVHFQPAPTQPHQAVVPRTPWVWGEWDQTPGSRPSITRNEAASGRSVPGSSSIRASITPSKQRRDEELESPIVRRIARREAPARTRR